MEEQPKLILKNFKIFPNQIRLLDTVNSNNHSEALRTILDDYEKKQNNTIEVVKDTLVIISIGLLFIVFSFNFTDILFRTLIVLFGIFLASFGFFGGIRYKIRRTKSK